MTKALERQLLSDVPVGFFLSGGLDSSAMVALARKLYPDKKINTYTIDTGGGFDGFKYFVHLDFPCRGGSLWVGVGGLGFGV